MGNSFKQLKQEILLRSMSLTWQCTDPLNGAIDDLTVCIEPGHSKLHATGYHGNTCWHIWGAFDLLIELIQHISEGATQERQVPVDYHPLGIVVEGPVHIEYT